MEDNEICKNKNYKREEGDGTIPLYAFLIGAVLLSVALLINSVTQHQGSWPDMDKAIWNIIILGVVAIFALFFTLWSFASVVLYKNKFGKPHINAVLALGLHGGYVFCIMVLYFIYS